MKYGSVCSGIEAASVAWHHLGWEAQWFSEIEHFPSQVLKYRFPAVENLGDMTKLMENKVFLESEIDVLVGGTPCQSFSVAGLRKGLEDPRGNLMLTFLALIDKKRPQWVVWENVPGVLSTNGGKDFQSFLDGLSELGYICDVEILDAQFFGVAQRRRRVFVCGQSVDSILKKKTVSSGLTIAQCLTEILHTIWIETLCLLGQEQKNLDQAGLSRDGVQMRMRLFGILTENCSYEMWRQLLVEVFRKSVPVQKYWDLPNGGKTEKELTLEDLLMGSLMESRYTLTEESLNKSLEDLYYLMKLYTTSTLTREIIQSKIYMFFQIGEVIGRLILRLSGLSPNSLSATSSFLTLSQNLTNYARQASRDIFNEMGGIYEVVNIIKQAEYRETTFGHLGDWRPAAAVLFERESLQRDIKPSRKKREEVAPDAEGGVKEASSWWDGSQVAGTLTKQNANGAQRMPDKDNLGAILEPIVIDRAAFNQGENAQYEPRIEEGETMSSLVAKGPHAVAQPIPVTITFNDANGTRADRPNGGLYITEKPQCTSALTCADNDTKVMQPIAYSFDALSSNSMKSSNPDSGCRAVDVAKTLDTTTPEPSKNQGGIAIAQPIAVDTYNQTINEHTTQTIRSNSTTEHIGAVLQPMAFDWQSGGDMRGMNLQDKTQLQRCQTPALLHSMAIRRLTPKECERLQGFPDDWTKIAYRNKPADQCPDGPRYKACGNSMAVPVMRWIGERISEIEELINQPL